MQWDNNPKKTCKSTTEWLKKKRVKVLQRSSQTPHLSLIGMLRDLKGAVQKQKLANFDELKQRCKEEWARIPPQRCERLMHLYNNICFKLLLDWFYKLVSHEMYLLFYTQFLHFGSVFIEWIMTLCTASRVVVLLRLYLPIFKTW